MTIRDYMQLPQRYSLIMKKKLFTLYTISWYSIYVYRVKKISWFRWGVPICAGYFFCLSEFEKKSATLIKSDGENNFYRVRIIYPSTPPPFPRWKEGGALHAEKTWHSVDKVPKRGHRNNVKGCGVKCIPVNLRKLNFILWIKEKIHNTFNYIFIDIRSFKNMYVAFGEPRF